MAPKRKPSGDGRTMESSADLAEPEDGTTESPADFAKPVYLVTAHEDDQAAYTVLKADAAAVTNSTRPPRAQAVAALPGGEPGMSFVSAHSKRGSWLVAVGGGLRAGTIILDPSTSATYRGPRLMEPKHEPVLISHGGEVFALSRRPRVVLPMDFEPWFESLSFNDGVPSLDCGGVLTGWHPLPSPPFFPLSLDPYEFRNPPEILVSSYAAVGDHILVSPQPELMVGTYAFHVANRTWEKVHEKNLPFVGQAVAVGGGSLFFAACAMSGSVVSLFYMSIHTSSSTSMAAVSTSLSYMSMDASSSTSTPVAAVSTTPSLSIQEFPVMASVEFPGRSSAPWERAGSTPSGWGHKEKTTFPPKKKREDDLSKEEVQVILTAFRIENIEAILSECRQSQSQGTKAKNLRVAVDVKEQSYTCNSKGRSRVLDSDILVAALSMDTENIDVSKREPVMTTGNQSTTVFKATGIRYWGRKGLIHQDQF